MYKQTSSAPLIMVPLLLNGRENFLLGLKELFKQQEDIQNVISGLEAGLHEQLVSGLSNSARTLYMTSIYEKTKKPLLIVTHNLLQAQKLYDDITNIVDEKEVFLYPA
ncbi:hypothetical protein SIN57_001847, partial [Campylobacter upsaliensis]|nr:hypothetical protein [Campylobacter upsaliensis]